MKLGLPEHVCKYFSDPWRHQRRCKQCKKSQYNYSGAWEDEISFARFVGKNVEAMGNGKPDLKLEIGTDFEYNCHESWGVFYLVSVLENGEWVQVGKFPDLNSADFGIQKHLTKLQNLP